MTTPDPIDLFKIFRAMVDSGIKYVIMEVSAHAIYLQKIYGLVFDIGAITNITQDHLDFFKTMENYAKTKLSFLYYCKKSLMNIEDKRIKDFSKTFKGNSIYIGGKDIKLIKILSMNKNNMKFKFSYYDNIIKIKTNLIGEFNTQNIIFAFLICKQINLIDTEIINAIEDIKEIDGRMMMIEKKDRLFIVDFAHTPDALLKAIRTAQSLKHNKLIVVFGCTGNRDKIKRPIMGKILKEYCDLVILTSDSPDNENPNDIINQMIGDIKDRSNLVIEPDRGKAIQIAYNRSNKKDIILIAGKGNEKYQIINGQKYYYNDIDEVYKCLKSEKY
jgi:UDP-N-acetylmuramoyl-L-alanyl-D-glutamate--2,6-diaminopimelate ligase